MIVFPILVYCLIIGLATRLSWLFQQSALLLRTRASSGTAEDACDPRVGLLSSHSTIRMQVHGTKTMEKA